MHAQGTLGILDGMKPSKRERMIFDCPERLRRAIGIRAAARGLRPSEVIVKLLEAQLTKELQQVDTSDDDEPPPPGKKRGPRSAE